MDKTEKTRILKILKHYPEIGLFYLFGSRARGDAGPRSDYDFAIYVDSKDRRKVFSMKLRLREELAKALKTDAVDVVLLNPGQAPELQYEIVQQGKLLFEREPFKVLVEPKILNAYFDFHMMISRHGLTKKKI